MLLIELKRAFFRRSFILAITVGVIFCLLSLVEALRSGILNDNYLSNYLKGNVVSPFDNFTLFNLSPISNILILILPLLSTLGYADSFLEDVKTGFIRLIYMRELKYKYLLSKYIANFLTAGLAFAGPLLLNIICLLLLVPSIDTHPILGKTTILPGGLFPEFYYTHPFLYIMLWIIIYFLYSGVFASLGLSLSIMVKNRFVILILPFILYFLTEIIAEITNKLLYSPQQFLYLSNSQSFNVILTEFFVVLAISFFLFFIGELTNETY